MIQRSQTLWLLVSVIAAALTFKFPFFSGVAANGTEGLQHTELNATYNVYTILLTAVSIILALLAIFMYKNRKLQLQLTLVGFLFAVGLMALYAFYMNKFDAEGRISLSALLSLFIIVGFFFAIRGIRRDQLLIKDLDRLR